MSSFRFAVSSLALLAATATSSWAAISITIGDNDGYGFGDGAVPDNADLLNINLPEDRRSLAEAAATNGAQQTDFYSAVFGPLPETFDVVFPLGGQQMLSATLTIDMGGFQVSDFGPILASYNGVLQPGLLNFDDGPFGTAVRTFSLGAAAIAAANFADEFRVTFERAGSTDAIAFDYFRLDAETAAVPELSSFTTFAVLGLCVAVATWWKSWRNQPKSLAC